MIPKKYYEAVSDLILSFKDISDGKILLDERNLTEFKKSIYNIEYYICKTKDRYEIHDIDSNFVSPDLINDDFINAKSDDYLRPIDYEYYLLVHLLTEHNDLWNKTLAQIIDAFFQRKNVREKLKPSDIERTKTGSVRCKTNLRFAVMYLRELGLISSYENGKSVWFLTLPGFLIAAHICLNKPFQHFPPFKFELQRLKSPDFCETYFHIDKKLIKAIEELTDYKTIHRIFEKVEKIKIDDNIKTMCHELFTDYNSFWKTRFNNRNVRMISKKEFSDNLKNFIFTTKYHKNLNVFKTRFSEFINTSRLLEEINEILSNNN